MAGLAKAAPQRFTSTIKRLAEGRIDKTQPYVFSGEAEDVGEDLATPVTEDYKEGDNKFTGTIEKIVADYHAATSRGRKSRGAPRRNNRRGYELNMGPVDRSMPEQIQIQQRREEGSR